MYYPPFSRPAVTSFPPLIGWSSTITLCGFAYGVPGWFIASAGALLGAAMSFVVLRLAFRERIQAWSRQNKKWQALENVVVRPYRLFIAR